MMDITWKPSRSGLVVLMLLAAFSSPTLAAETTPAAAPPGILAFYRIASDRAAAPPDEARLVVACEERLRGADLPAGYEGLRISFLGAQPVRIQLVAFTQSAIGSPADVIALRPVERATAP